MAMVGTVGSYVTVIVTAGLLVFPTVSVAVTVMTLLPIARGMAPTVHEVVPVAEPLPPVAAFDQATEATPTLSDAVPESTIGVDRVMNVGGAGETIVTVGFVLSRTTMIWSGEVFPAVSVAVTVMTFAPARRLMIPDPTDHV